MADRNIPNAGAMEQMVAMMRAAAKDPLSAPCQYLTTALVECFKDGAGQHSLAEHLEKPGETANPIEKQERDQKRDVWHSIQSWVKRYSPEIEFFPIVYTWLLTKTHLGGEADNFGGIVFADNSFQRFLSVNYYDQRDYPKYQKLNDLRARQIAGALKYIGVPDVKWVRSTYILPKSGRTRYTLPPLFLQPVSELDAAPSDTRLSATAAPVVHITPSNVAAALSTGDISRMEVAIAQAGGLDLAGGVSGRQTRHASVLMAGGTQCDQCEKTAADLLRCSACKLAFYCTPECQRNAWGNHKIFCKELKKKREAAAAA